MMREQGVAANATPRVVRGRDRGRTKDAVYRARRRGDPSASPERALPAATGRPSRTAGDLARSQLLRTRESVMAYWHRTADVLDAQGEIELAGDVRYFAHRLLPTSVDRDHLPARLAGFGYGDARQSSTQQAAARDRDDELAR